MAIPGLYQTSSKKSSVNLLSNNSTHLFNELYDKVDKSVVQKNLEVPTDQQCNVCTCLMYVFI
jgi:hypothetical protein